LRLPPSLRWEFSKTFLQLAINTQERMDRAAEGDFDAALRRTMSLIIRAHELAGIPDNRLASLATVALGVIGLRALGASDDLIRASLDYALRLADSFERFEREYEKAHNNESEDNRG